MNDMWPAWSAHPLDEPCPPGCPSREAEISDFFRSGYGREPTVDEFLQLAADWDGAL